MALDKIRSHVQQILTAARQEHGAPRWLAALALVYTAIDVLGSLERAEGEGVRKSFTRWAEAYVLPRDSIPCTAIDLYAARCGVLHSLTPDADLVRKGEARRIAYAWGSGSATDLREIARRVSHEDLVILHIGDLIDAVEAGFVRFLEEVQADDARLKVVQAQGHHWFANLSLATAEEVLEVTGGRAPSPKT